MGLCPESRNARVGVLAFACLGVIRVSDSKGGLSLQIRVYAGWTAFQEKFLKYICAVLLFGATSLALVEVIRRYVFGLSVYWQQDVVIYSILTGLFLHFGITQRLRAHLRVSLLPSLLLKKGRIRDFSGHLMNLVAQVVSVGYLAIFTYYVLRTAQGSKAVEQLVFSQIMPFWPWFLALAIGAAFMAISFVFQIYQEVQALRGKQFIEEEHII